MDKKATVLRAETFSRGQSEGTGKGTREINTPPPRTSTPAPSAFLPVYQEGRKALQVGKQTRLVPA